ncbi:MAG: hypothetical protein CMM46_03455 [Rhodospirillaceae bacterium]|nr:hypothetical protein [Rhodospirillaceae bacterium]
MITTTVLFALSVPFFLWNYRKTPDPRFHLGCLRNRNVALSLTILLVFNMVSTGLFQVEFLGKDPEMTADIFGPRTAIGAATLLGGFALADYLCREDRLMLCFMGGIAFSLIAKSGFILYDSHTAAFQAIWPVAVGGVGFGLMAGLLATTAYRTVDEHHAAHVATAFILATYLGASLGAGVLEEIMVLFDTLLLSQSVSEHFPEHRRLQE